MIDIIVFFNSSYYDSKTNRYVTSRKQIAKNYLCGWFILDFIAVFPFDKVISLIQSQTNTDNVLIHSVGKFAKLSRFYRATKLFRLFKMSKLAKEREKMQETIQTKLKFQVAAERLLIFVMGSLVFVHLIACIWILIGFQHQVENS